jgi:histone acetyltransferase 1
MASLPVVTPAPQLLLSSRTILSDEPRLSSAALCTTLNLLDASFRPEFTHQCVEQEVFRGHRPVSSVVNEEEAKLVVVGTKDDDSKDNKKAVLHKSHIGHEDDEDDQAITYELDIQITLAPSGRQSHVAIHRHPILTTTTTTTRPTRTNTPNASDDDDDPPAAKKVKIGNTAVSSNANETATTSSANGACRSATTTTTTPLSNDEIQQSIANALPTIVTDAASCRDDYLSEPIGSVLTEYSVTVTMPTLDQTQKTKTFVLTLADAVAAADYHAQVQKLALWFIENADDVDIANCESGFWKVLYIFEKETVGDDDNNDNDNKETTRYSLVGYMTLFHFSAPFHKPEPGILVRICQALVLPPYQGQGHGTRLMMQGVYDMAHNGKCDGAAAYSNDDPTTIVQVNVEDPAPAFVALRNKMDLQLLTDHPDWWPISASSNSQKQNTNKPTTGTDDETFFTGLSDADALQTSALAKITPRQVQLVKELQALQACLPPASASASAAKGTTSTNNNTEEDGLRFKRFRLMVKKRLNKEHREDMSAYPTKDEKKAFLATLFVDEYRRYQAVLLHSSKKNQARTEK